ncbi:hypothetical protein [uncultured Stenotrophomonas sp.]|jgi:hypothetical protein|uniref:hypothetical protein n=1 Tax=uncultured Stenotrophomonas sp. TaxID=165438 RepID=UPI0025DB08C1|nr:hypothetical protein [uncultured Stenotrophomonas sp.]
MKGSYRAGVPLAAFVAASVWGMLAMQPLAPNPHESMMWIPATVAGGSLVMAWVAAVIVDRAAASQISSAAHTWLFLGSSVMIVALVLLAVMTSMAQMREVFELVVLCAAFVLVLIASTTFVFASVRYKARITASTSVMVIHSIAFAFSAFLSASNPPEAGALSEGWFAASILACGISAVFVSTYWVAALRDPSLSFSPMLRSLVRFITGESRAKEWCSKHLIRSRSDPSVRTRRGGKSRRRTRPVQRRR